ncbi:MAG: hypothetical protein KY410_10640, partial [Proteobacteria bacterium]|nr:hypothetical protein [Pseudomonadota bacterium]
QPLNQAECDTHGVISESATATPYAKRLNYDYLGITTPTGMTTRGFTTVVTDQSGRAKTTVKNVLDRVLGVKENDGSSDIATYFGYDVLGNTTTVQPPDGGAVTMSYDTAGRKTSMIDPDMGTWTYDYTGFGELQWQIDAVGNRVDMVYDKLGRMVSRTDTPDAGAVKTTAWVYDNAYGAGVGKLAHVANADGYAETYAYNEYGQATDTVRLADGEVYWTSQTYDAEGRPDILVYPDVATFDTDASAPAAVTLTVPANNTGEVGITWTRDNPFATYRLYRSTSSSGYDESVPVYLGPLNAFTDTVSENGTYYYWVDACHGDVCTETGPASTITLLPPPAPAFLDVENYDAENDGSVSLSWGASVGQDNYIIRRAGSLNGTYTDIAAPTGTSTTLSLAEDEHYFQVVACRGSSCSAPTPGDSSAVVHYRPGLLPAPTFTTTFVHNVTGVEDDAVTIDGAAAVDVHAPADPFVQFHEIDVYRYGLLIDTRRFFDGLSDPLEVSGLPNGEIHFKARACKISNADSLCGPDSAASTTLLAGTRPSQFPSLSAITPQSTKTFTLSFGNPENIKSGGPYQVWLQEARDAGFEETSAPVAVPNGSFETCEDTESPTGEDPSPPTCTIHSAPPTSVEVTTASNGKYWYGLYACHETFGCSSPREFGPVDIHTVPSKPVSITSNGSIDGTDWLIASDESFIISWAGSSDTVDRYQFEQRMLPASDYTEVALAADTATSKTYSGKAPGQYFYRVKACYEIGR